MVTIRGESSLLMLTWLGIKTGAHQQQRSLITVKKPKALWVMPLINGIQQTLGGIIISRVLCLSLSPARVIIVVSLQGVFFGKYVFLRHCLSYFFSLLRSLSLSFSLSLSLSLRLSLSLFSGNIFVWLASAMLRSIQ